MPNTEITDVSFASFLRLQLQQTGTKITELAAYIGVTRTCIYRYLGKTYDARFQRAALPSPKTMEKILEYFDIPASKDFLQCTRKRGWLLNRSRKRYKKFLKRWGTEYYPTDDYTLYCERHDEIMQKVLTTNNKN